MLVAVDPLLHRIEAVPEHGCYSVTFLLDGNHERSVIMKVTDRAMPTRSPRWSFPRRT